MNSLSWLIYAIGLFENLRAWADGGFGALIFLGIIGSIFGYIMSGAILSSTRGSYESDDDVKERISLRTTIQGITKKMFYFCAIAGIFMMTVSIVIPKKETMMYIAASEIGGRIAQNEIFQKNALEALEGSKDAIKSVGGFGGEILGLSQDSVKLLRSYMQGQINKDEPAIVKPEEKKE